MKYIFLLYLILCSVPGIAQECQFDPYQKIGGSYYLSTFYQNYDKNQKREGVCSMNANGKPYAYREFKNGQLQIERLYQYETGKIYSDFQLVKKDSIFGELVYRSDGTNLELKQTFYLDKEGMRCWKQEDYRQGKLWRVCYYRSFLNIELIAAGYPSRPDHLIDADGYTDVHAQFGAETIYHANGKLLSRTEHKLIVSDSPNYYPSQDGSFVQYAENGVEVERGTYKGGHKNGEFVYHHMNGKLSAKKSYANDIPTGDWIEYYDDGSLYSTISYGDTYYWPTGHEKRYFKSGTLQYESVIYKNGAGFKHEFYEDGSPKEKTTYAHGPNERTTFKQWYPNGQLKEKSYLRAQNDTLGVEFYEDGFPKIINLYKNGNSVQEIKRYYVNHQLETESYTELRSEKTYQLLKMYSQTGVLITTLETIGKRRIHKEFWANGKPKFEKEFDDNLLNGHWVEQDSSGKVLKDCEYRNGFRKGICKKEPKPIELKLTGDQEEMLLFLAVEAIASGYYENNLIIEEQTVRDRALALGFATRFLLANYPDFEFPTTTEKRTDFEYLVYLSNTDSARHGKQLDSIFNVLGWIKSGKADEYGNEYSFRYRSSNFYSPKALDAIFQHVLPTVANIIHLDNPRWKYPEMDYSRNPKTNQIAFERVMEAKAWKITIAGNTVAVYDDGYTEMYNGSVYMKPSEFHDKFHRIGWD